MKIRDSQFTFFSVGIGMGRVTIKLKVKVRSLLFGINIISMDSPGSLAIERPLHTPILLP